MRREPLRRGGGVDIDFVGKMECPKEEILFVGVTTTPIDTVQLMINNETITAVTNEYCVFNIKGNNKVLTSFSMSGFSSSSYVKTISSFNYDTSKLTSLSYAFYGCYNLIYICPIDTSNVTDMYAMFYNCTKITNLPYFDTSKVTDMSGMFKFCRELNDTIDYDTSKVTAMDYMFDGCQRLTKISLLDTHNLLSAEMMFNDCVELTTLGGFKGLKVNLDLSDSKSLTHESLMNVINYAADVTSDPKTLTLGSTNLAKLTDDEKAIAANKGWTLK